MSFNPILPLAVVLLAPLLGALHAQAIPIPLGNPSFESEVNPSANGSFGDGDRADVSGWTSWTVLTTENGASDADGQTSVGFRDIAPADGNQVMSLMGGASIGQVSGLAWSDLSAGDVLTLTIAVGDRSTSTTWTDESFFGLSDGLATGALSNGSLLTSLVASSDLITLPPAGVDSGTMSDLSLNYTVQVSDLSRSGNVGLAVASYGNIESSGQGISSGVFQAFFDNVRLSRTPMVANRPNLVFFFFDDMRWDAASFTGNSVITTPNMDTLASQGTVFENAFVTTAICMVSRASVFSGQHMARHGITSFNNNLSAAKWQNAYPDRLADAGYYMGFIGKHGLGSNFTALYGTYDFNKGWDGQGSYFGQTIDGESANGRHVSEFIGDLAVEFLGDVVSAAANPSAAPFCLQISWKAPHVQDGSGNPFQNDPAYDALYAGDTIPRAKTDTQAQFDDLPPFLKASNAAGTSRANQRFGTESLFQESIKKHHRLIHGVDVQIGRIMAALNDPNGDGDPSDSIADNTIVIISSDHGFFLNERKQAGKWYIQEESIRVPMVIVDPRLPVSLQNKRVPQMALNIDIAATLLDYAATPIPPEMQGVSLRPIVEGNPPNDWRTNFFHHHPNVGSVVFANEGVRTENFVYIRYPSDGNFQQLYDISVDPYQRTNLADDPRYAAKLLELDQLTTQLKAEAQ